MTSITKRRSKDIPALLAQLCRHPQCPEWLKVGIWDSVNEAANSAGRQLRFDEEWFRHEFSYLKKEVAK